MTAFPWSEVIATGIGRLRLSPKDFWALTPREFAVLAGETRTGPAGAPGRSALDAMMSTFPDRKDHNDG